MMNNKLSGWDDTIVALATPAGVGAIAVIRISGKESMRIIDEIFPSKRISEQHSHTLHVGILRDKEGPIDEVVVSVYRNPKSFTGEDCIEISCLVGWGNLEGDVVVVRAVQRDGGHFQNQLTVGRHICRNGEGEIAVG